MKCVFIVLDTVRRDYLEAYGNNWVKTPHLSRLARDGVTFDNHWAGSLPCMPARREFMTGRYNLCIARGGRLSHSMTFLPVETSQARRFFSSSHRPRPLFRVGRRKYHTGFDTWEFFRGQENDPWVSQVDAVALPENLSTKLNKQNWLNRTRQQQEADFSGPRTAQAAVDWLHANRDAKGDWFLQVELFDPHEPFYCPDEYRALYGDDWDGPLYDWPSYEAAQDSPEAVAHIRKCYAGLLTMTDFWVGEVLDALHETGQWDETLIIFTTDHGTMLTEHGYWMKNYMPVTMRLRSCRLSSNCPKTVMRASE
jgi:arylsulfatase A-like enzyme